MWTESLFRLMYCSDRTTAEFYISFHLDHPLRATRLEDNQETCPPKSSCSWELDLHLMLNPQELNLNEKWHFEIPLTNYFLAHLIKQSNSVENFRTKRTLEMWINTIECYIIQWPAIPASSFGERRDINKASGLCLITKDRRTLVYRDCYTC